MDRPRRRSFGAWPTWAHLALGVLVGFGMANVGRPGDLPVSKTTAPLHSPPPADLISTTTGATGTLSTGESITTVESITDGDTLRTAGGLRVRLIGIDTPETSGGKQCFGEEAKAHLSQLVPPGTSVRLVYDKERQDRYGRDLAYVYRTGDGAHVNLAMVVDGYAKTLSIKPNTAHATEFAEAAARAKAASLAMWAACPAA